MSMTFDPYHKWLGIPRQEQPPHYYRLLAIPLYEDDPQVIEGAADRQMAFLRRFQSGEHSEQAKTLLNEVACARLCLLKPETRSHYDQQLKVLLGQPDESDEATAAESEADEISEDLSMADPILESPLTSSEVPIRARRPVWQQPVVLVGMGLVLATLVGLFVVFNKPAPLKNPPLAGVTKKSNSSVGSSTTAESNPTSEVEAGTNTGKSVRRGRSDQSRPLATGDKAPWPTLLDSNEEEKTGSSTEKTSPGKSNVEKTEPRSSKVPVIAAKENLILKVDPIRDAVQGQWKLEQGVLISGIGLRDRIHIPGKVPQSYTLTIVAERQAETGFGLMTYLPVGKSSVLATLDGWNGETCALDQVNNQEGDLNETMTIGPFTQQGMNTFVYRVQPSQIEVEANGRKVLEWSGDPSVLSIHPQYVMPKPAEVGLAVFGAEWRIHGVSIAPRPQSSVKSRSTAGRPALQRAGFKVPVIGSAENLIPKIDLKRDSVQGVWKVDDGVLVVPGGPRDRIRIPVKVPAAYTLTMIAEPTQPGHHGLLMILPVGKGQAMACVDCWEGRACGLEAIRGIQGNANETTTYARLTKPGVNTYVYHVTPDSVRVHVNGRKAIDWKGDSTTLAVHPLYAIPKIDEIGLAGAWVEWRVLGIKLVSEVPKVTPDVVADVAVVPGFEDALQGSVAKMPVPDDAAQMEAKKILKELFKIDYAQAKKPEGKIALARTLFSRGQEVDNDPRASYVMLMEAADLAAEAGQLGIAWDALNTLGNRFECGHLQMMERAARTAAPFAKTFDEVRELSRMYADLINEAVRVNDYDTASKVAQAATQAVRKPLFAALKDQVATMGKRVSTLRDGFEVVKSAREILRTKPTDPAACLAWGRFVCFHKNNWADGLPLLALGTDPVLSPLAQRELAMNEQTPPPESKDIAKLGDDWWAISDQEKEPLRSHIRDHAAESYLLAQGGVTGLEKAGLQQKADRIFGTTKFSEAQGDKDGVTIAPAELNPGNLFTIEFWISTSANTGSLVSKRQVVGGESSMILFLRDGVPEIVSNADDYWEGAAGKTKINDGKWHHIAGVRLAKQLLLFVDGKKEGQVAGLDTYSSKSSWKAGVSIGVEQCALRLCRLRISNSARYLIRFTPEKQYGKDSATVYPK